MTDGVRLLPVPLAGFVGRGRERAAVGRLLASSRLLTLTGPGGVGKTRLGLEAARLAGGDVAFVEFGTLSDAALLAQTVAATLDVTESGEQSVLTTRASNAAASGPCASRRPVSGPCSAT
jgi:predicted ATPase